MSSVDVVVIGAGPAGSASAIGAAQAGLRVVLLERLDFPRHRPGETLPPGVEPLFRQLGVWEEIERAAFIRHPGQRVAWQGPEKYSEFGGTKEGPWRGFQAWRPVLDTLLLRRAAALGVSVLQPCRAVSPLSDNGRVLGLLTDRGEIRARFVVDATGGAGWLPRKLGWRAERHSPRLIANYGHIETSKASKWLVPQLRATKDGWLWTAQVRPQLVAWTRLCFGDAIRGAPVRLAALPDARRLAGGGSSADVTWRRESNPAGPGYFLVGDAAMVLDPASSHGVLRALMSGMMAAHLGAQICKNQISEPIAAAAYCDWLRGWFEHDAGKLAGFYGQLASPPRWLRNRTFS